MTREVEANYSKRAKAELRKQRQRNLHFSNPFIFGDPAWEFVLEAYIAGSEDKCVALSDLGHDLCKPVAIITRLAIILEVEGYVERCHSHNNQDIRCVRLTEDAVIWCERCLEMKLDASDFQNN